ncbi:MAG: GerW family sporulation protein [Firmicutes bacterium]|nr:GerW family sporulation protein [Bacillota bacterium]
MSSETEIQGLMQTAMSSLKQIVDVNTIVGEKIDGGNGVSVVPVSRVSCGFVAGGGEYGSMGGDLPFAGGSGAGISVQPVGFLVMQQDQVRLIPVCGATVLDKAIEAVPLVADQVDGLLCRFQQRKHRYCGCGERDYMPGTTECCADPQ